MMAHEADGKGKYDGIIVSPSYHLWEFHGTECRTDRLCTSECVSQTVLRQPINVIIMGNEKLLFGSQMKGDLGLIKSVIKGSINRPSIVWEVVKRLKEKFLLLYTFTLNVTLLSSFDSLSVSNINASRYEVTFSK